MPERKKGVFLTAPVRRAICSTPELILLWIFSVSLLGEGPRAGLRRKRLTTRVSEPRAVASGSPVNLSFIMIRSLPLAVLYPIACNDEKQKAPHVFTRGADDLTEPVATAPGTDIVLVSDPDAEASAVVVIVIIVDRQNQPAIHGHTGREVAPHQIRRTQLAIGHADIGDQCANSGAGQRPGVDHRSETTAARTVRPDLTDAATGDNRSAGRDRYRIAGPQVDTGI